MIVDGSDRHDKRHADQQSDMDPLTKIYLGYVASLPDPSATATSLAAPAV